MTVLPVNNNGDSNTIRRRLNCSQKLCSVKTVKKRLPIVKWLPSYNATKLIQDIIAGITVGLTSIPQGIAYAVVAGLSPEYGLYAGLMGGFVYCVVGSCKDVTIGTTAIMAAMISKYVINYSADFAVLITFLAGLVQLTMGILQLGFLVEFISLPVISGFTTAAALQIASVQLKSLFGLSGKSGNNFAESVYYFTQNIKTAKLWEPVLGFLTIAMLISLNKLGQGCSRNDGFFKQLRWYISLGRNAIVVIFGMTVAYILKLTTDSEPLLLIGDIGSGVPKIALPPFATMVGNETYYFGDMINVLGPQSVVIPLVAILEIVAIAKAFAGGKSVDATQEMIAIGFCNIIGSLVRSTPVTGSFTRTALNNASGVQTPAGGIFTGLLILSALSLLTQTFYFIPKASLAGVIITAMFSMIDFAIFGKLWRNNKIELFFLIVTMGVSLCVGLEYGIVAGVLVQAATLLYFTSRPKVKVNTDISESGGIITIPLNDRLSYCAAEHIRRTILRTLKHLSERQHNASYSIIIDGTNVHAMDSTVASNLLSIAEDLEKGSCNIFFLNFSNSIAKLCLDINPKFINKFIKAPSADAISKDLYQKC